MCGRPCRIRDNNSEFTSIHLSQDTPSRADHKHGKDFDCTRKHGHVRNDGDGRYFQRISNGAGTFSLSPRVKIGRPRQDFSGGAYLARRRRSDSTSAATGRTAHDRKRQVVWRTSNVRTSGQERSKDVVGAGAGAFRVLDNFKRCWGRDWQTRKACDSPTHDCKNLSECRFLRWVRGRRPFEALPFLKGRDRTESICE